jgi:hypothetical protein
LDSSWPTKALAKAWRASKPARKQTSTRATPAMTLARATPPIVSTGSQSAMGLATTIMKPIALAITTTSTTTGIKKTTPPIAVVRTN